MTMDTEHNGNESADAQEARRALDDYVRRTSARTRQDEGAGPLGVTEPGSVGVTEPAPGGLSPAGGRVDDHVAESVAREAWDAVQDATPAPPDPEAGPAEKTDLSPERAELHRRAVAIARGLRELGYHLDETLLPGPDMAAG
ncbi:hypothetical protein ACGFW5_20070 [Streptomyces sp. NPDC048416]|uniref:hypothetical protein n=1 Tax=Streptomyces sp. NPDC048416 TaxID=3365546 RepID=UPI00372410B6